MEAMKVAKLTAPETKMRAARHTRPQFPRDKKETNMINYVFFYLQRYPP